MIVTLFAKSLKTIFSDKMLLLLSLIPVLIGIFIYWFLGAWIYGQLDIGVKWLTSYLGGSEDAGIISWIIGVIFGLIFYFLVNWTFVMIVSVVASPFNDLISSRVETKHFNGETVEIVSSKFLSRIFKIVWNEIKKVILILLMTLVAALAGFIPVVGPFISIALSGILLAIQFVDYSWSRRELTSKECVADAKKNILYYGLSGAGFVVLISIPIVNLLTLPLAVVYYTFMFLERD